MRPSDQKHSALATEPPRCVHVYAEAEQAPSRWLRQVEIHTLIMEHLSPLGTNGVAKQDGDHFSGFNLALCMRQYRG